MARHCHQQSCGNALVVVALVAGCVQVLIDTSWVPRVAGDEAWAEKLRALIQLGPDAVPELIEELDATDNDRMLRCLGFVLRGIGDKRAVAPLIRAIPRTLRPLGMTAWQVENDRWQSIDQEVPGAEPLELGTPAAGLLSPFDEASGKFSPADFATFLFVTREGTCGILFVGAEVNDTNVIVGVPAQGDQDRDPVGFYKGRRFGFKIIAEKDPDDAK